jgi:hypothetical protein
MIIDELKTELYSGLKESLDQYTDVIFRDDSGDVWSWASAGIEYESCANRNVKDALQNTGLAIVVCGCDKRTTIDSVSHNALRSARFPILILTNKTTSSAPNPNDVVICVEQSVLEIQSNPASDTGWELGDGIEFNSPGSSVLFAVHNYQV